MIKKRAQAWGLDLIIATFIFLSAIMLFYFYSLNTNDQAEEKLQQLTFEGNYIVDSLLTEGYPAGWNSANVIKIGLTTNNKINDSKIEQFHSLVNADYPRAKALLNTKYDFYMNLSEVMIIQGSPVSGIGHLDSSAKNLIKLSRFSSYRDEPVTVYIYIWD